MKSNPFQQIILKALKENEASRDDDLLLFGIVLMRMGIDIGRQTTVEMIVGMQLGDIPTCDTVTRLRREIQEKDPSVRGRRYYDRHRREILIIEEKREAGAERYTVLT